MTQKTIADNQVMHKGKCTGHCTYKISINGKMLICEDCGRVKAIRESSDAKWEMLF
jgi:hypothetical protein